MAKKFSVPAGETSKPISSEHTMLKISSALGIVLWATGCGPIISSRHIESAGVPIVSKRSQLVSTKLNAKTVEKDGQYYVIGEETRCYQDTIAKTQMREEVIERHTSPSVLTVVGYGVAVGATMGAAYFITGLCETNACETAQSVAVVGGTGILGIMGAVAIANGIRSIDGSEPAEPDHHETSVGSPVCRTERAPGLMVYVGRLSKPRRVGKLDDNGVIVLERRFVEQLASAGRTYVISIDGRAMATLNLDRANDDYCRDVAKALGPDVSATEKSLSVCTGSSSRAVLEEHLASLYREQERRIEEDRAAKLRAQWADTDKNNLSQVESFVRLCDSVGNGPHCGDARRIVRAWKQAFAVASCAAKAHLENECAKLLEQYVGSSLLSGATCNSIVQLMDSGDVSAGSVVRSAAVNAAAHSDSETARAVAAGVQILDFIECYGNEMRRNH